MAAQRAPFPTDSSEFAEDDRISYSKQAQTFVLEDEQGEEWEWLASHSKWTKTMDEALMKQQAEAYKVAGVDEDAPALNPAQKRKEAMLEDPETNPKNAKAADAARAKAKAKAPAVPRQNTAVFVTGLPMDTDQKEVKNYFTKFGMIAESIDDNEKRVKLYNDKEGNFKGEALIIYHRPESVGMAVMIADGADFVREDPNDSTGPITVTEADTSFKAHKDDTVAEERTKAKPRGSKVQAKKKAEEMNSRLADWSDDDISTMPQTSSRNDKTIILKNVFTFEAIRNDPDFLQDVREDMEEMAAQFGEVKNVTIFDQEEDGIVTVRFANAEAARAFGMRNDGRIYDGRTVETFIADGTEKFKKTRKAFVDKDAEEAKRLEEYSNFIEGKGNAKDDATDGAKGDSSKS